MPLSASTMVLSSLLAFTSPLVGSSAQCAGPVHPFGAQIHPLSRFPSFDEGVQQLDVLVADLRQRVGQGDEQAGLRNRVRLELERLRHFPDRSASDAQLDARFTDAMLVVAASIYACDPEVAQAWVDRALARGPIAAPDLGGLPADFVALYNQRALALSSADPATIQIQCDVACSVFIDGQAVPVVVGEVQAHSVVPGTHDVWIARAPERNAKASAATTRVSVSEIALDSGVRALLSFPEPKHTGLLPTREEWWSSWSFAQRVDWAIEAKKTLVNFETSTFIELVDESPVHARVLSHDPQLRELRIRAALHLADLWEQSGEAEAANAILDRTLLWAQLRDSSQTLRAAVGKFPGLIEPFEERAALLAASPRGTIEVACRRCLPVIDGVVIDGHALELPVGRYRVGLLSSSTGTELSVFEAVEVRAGETTQLQTNTLRAGKPHIRAAPRKAAALEKVERRRSKPRRWLWGAVGGLAVGGGAVACIALAPDPAVALALGLLGGATLGVGGTLLVGARRHERSRGAQVSLAPSISPSALGLELGASF